MKSFPSKPVTTLAACIIAAFFSCLTIAVKAQDKEFVLKGVVFRNNTTQRVAKVLVANLNTNAIVNTDDLGVFEIKCSMGDSLLVRQKDYSDKKVKVNTENTIMVYLQSNVQLAEVNIREASQKQQLQEVMKEYNSEGVYNNGKSPSTLAAIMSPVNSLYNALGSGPKSAKRFQRYTDAELQQTAVDRRFTKALVTRVTGMTDTTKLKDFVQGYKPSYDDIKKMNDYDLIDYVKKSYVDYKKNGEKAPAVDKLF